MTYDLAIAKMALRIQAEESPKFDNGFVNLCTFHVEVPYSTAIGKFIAESGPTFLLSKCVNQLLAAALEVLHFQSFLETADVDTNLTNVLQD